MEQESVCDDKKCQATKPAKSVCDDKNCKYTQCIHMWPVKSSMKSNHMWSVRPTILQSTYKKCSQSRPVSVCDDKNCHSAKCAHMWTVKPAMPQSIYKMSSPKKCQVKSEGTQSSSVWSLSKTARLRHSLKYLGTLSIPQASTVIHLGVQLCVQFQEIKRYNPTTVIPEVPRCNLHS